MSRTDRVWTPVELIRWTDGYLTERGFLEGRLNAERLLASVLGLRRLDLYLQFERPLTGEELAEYKVRLRRRMGNEPLQYIEGSASFRKLELTVDRRVLIPRPETELLVGEVLTWAARRQPDTLDALDIGTGSGAIALSLFVEGHFRQIVATDASKDALDLAKENACRVGAEGRVDFRPGALYLPVGRESFDVIVSNPPYVEETARSGMDAEVVEWEPSMALFAGPDGLDVIRPLVAHAPDHLRQGGLLAIEIGASQGLAVAGLVRETGAFGAPRVQKDYAGRDRLVFAERLPAV
ncbi:MAG: peptide chain release factor N(5)-glutamine methyltransferase [Gemmatimonadota bacterium]|nr:peptide chain release factor N(5)-glutamine methyltransferase [Gemmatimonadota bacterium]